MLSPPEENRTWHGVWELRQQLVRHAKANWADLLPWDVGRYELEGFCVQTQNMFEWGGALQVHVWANMTGCQVRVEVPGAYWQQYGDSGPVHALLCWVHRKGAPGHYDLLVPAQCTPEPGPPGQGVQVGEQPGRVATTLPIGKGRTDRLPAGSKRLLTVNVSGGKEHMVWALSQKAQIVVMQEHRASNPMLPEWQAAAERAGWHGVWQEARTTSSKGRSAGVAILVPADCPIFRGPGKYSHRWVRASVPWTRTAANHFELFVFMVSIRGTPTRP